MPRRRRRRDVAPRAGDRAPLRQPRPRRSSRGRSCSRSTSPASSTTSCAASTAARSATTAAPEQVIATTQMQATDCRRAFPCWDEPDLKAVFGITLVVDPDLLAVSNGAEIAGEKRPDGKVAVRFADTMPMSTYLVAFVVGPLEATEPVDVDGIAAADRPRARQGPPHRVRARGRRVRPALVRALLRHPVPERQGRPAGPPRLRRRGDGEPRLHHLPREACCSSTRPRARRPSSRTSPTSSPTSSPTCGSATSSRCAGGTGSG